MGKMAHPSALLFHGGHPALQDSSGLAWRLPAASIGKMYHRLLFPPLVATQLPRATPYFRPGRFRPVWWPATPMGIHPSAPPLAYRHIKVQKMKKAGQEAGFFLFPHLPSALHQYSGNSFSHPHRPTGDTPGHLGIYHPFSLYSNETSCQVPLPCLSGINTLRLWPQ